MDLLKEYSQVIRLLNDFNMLSLTNSQYDDFMFRLSSIFKI